MAVIVPRSFGIVTASCPTPSNPGGPSTSVRAAWGGPARAGARWLGLPGLLTCRRHRPGKGMPARSVRT